MSHVSTTEWQSFEGRMRRRRAERCVLRAEEALAAGFDDAAREALDEARVLTPDDTPTFDEVRARVAERAIVAEPPAAAPTRRRRWPAAAAILTTAAGLAGMGAYSQWREPAAVIVATPPIGTTPLATLETRPPATPAARIERETVHAVRDVASDVMQPNDATRRAQAMPVGPVRASLTSDPAVPTMGPDALPPVVGTAPSVVSPEPPPPAPAEVPRANAGAPIDSLVSSAQPAAAVIPMTPVMSLRAAPAADPPPTAPEPAPAEQRIRAVLSAYEAAFRALDASAARSVWPAVDARALARAFDGLASQSISLGGCSITVQGNEATALCTGSATWTPKVGGGARTEIRKWDFALERTGSRWQIVRAVTRSR